MIGNYTDQDDLAWINDNDLENAPNAAVYIISAYFIYTSVIRVGYGDYSGKTSLELIYCMFLEVLGFMFYSYLLGSLTSIIQQRNELSEELRQKVDMLDDIKRDYNLSIGLYDIAKQSLLIQHQRDRIDSSDMLDSLPYRLRVEICTFIVKSKIQSIHIFKNKSEELKAYLIPKLKYKKVKKRDWIYKDGDFVD